MTILDIQRVLRLRYLLCSVDIQFVEIERRDLVPDDLKNNPARKGGEMIKDRLTRSSVCRWHKWGNGGRFNGGRIGCGSAGRCEALEQGCELQVRECDHRTVWVSRGAGVVCHGCEDWRSVKGKSVWGYGCLKVFGFRNLDGEGLDKAAARIACRPGRYALYKKKKARGEA